MGRRWRKALLILVLILGMMLQCACGQEKPSYQMGGTTVEKDLQMEYSGAENVPVTGDGIVELEVLEEMSDDVYKAKEMIMAVKWSTFKDGRIYGDGFYYPKLGGKFVSNAFSGGNVWEKSVTWEEAPSIWSVRKFCFDPSGNLYAYGEVGDLGFKLLKFDSELNWQYTESLGDFEEELGDGEILYVSWGMAADAEGRVYLSTDTDIYLYDEQGIYRGEVAFESAGISILDILTTAEGKVYLLYAKGSPVYSYLAEIDFTGKTITNLAKTKELEGLTADLEGNLYAFNSDKMYGLDLEKGQMQPLFTWTECGIIGLEIREVNPTDDGRWAVLNGNDSSGTGQVTLLKQLTKEEAAVLPEKQEIVIGLMGNASTALSQAMVHFNRESDLYKVTTRNYFGDKELEAARNQLNAEIVSGKGPDILVDVHMKDEVYEDLYPYLEESEALSKEDFFDRILELYTVDGRLTEIPHDFDVYTLMGSAELLGEETGWTLTEMLQCIEQNPDKLIAKYIDRSIFLHCCMLFNEELFIDWESGVCSFDREEFKAALQVAAKLPEAIPKTEGSELEMAGNGELLLVEVCTMRGLFTSLQPASRVLPGGFNCIGYPTSEGVGSHCVPRDVMAISTQSDCKEGAWAFLEYYLRYRASNIRDQGLPVLKSYLEEIAEESMKENGIGVGDYRGDIKIKTATQKEVDTLWQQLYGMRVGSASFDNVLTIIKEEAAAYFEGQKTLDAVVEIIQSRVQVYVDENRG